MSGGGRRMTPRGEMSGSGSGPPLFHLPPNLKAMFEPRPPVEFKPPPIKRKMPPYGGLASYMTQFELTNPPPRILNEDPQKRKARKLQEKTSKHLAEIEEELKEYDPSKNYKATEDAYRTLFLGRLSYDTNAKKIRREFEQYGPIKDVKVIQDLDGNPRGYAFIEFEKEEDMKSAYKRADGKKIDSKRILVDVERGRTVRGWKPRRLGGGLGGRKDKQKTDKKKAPVVAPPSIYGGGASRPERSTAPPNDSRDRPRDRGADRNGGGDRYGGGGDRYGASGGGGGYRGDARGPRDRSRSRDRGGGGGGRSNRGGGGGYGSSFSGAYGPGDRGGGGDSYRGGDRDGYRGGSGGDGYRGGGGDDKYGPGGGAGGGGYVKREPGSGTDDYRSGGHGAGGGPGDPYIKKERY